MPLRINTNVDAANASRHLGITQALLSQSLAQLASGKRINSAATCCAASRCGKCPMPGNTLRS